MLHYKTIRRKTKQIFCLLICLAWGHAVVAQDTQIQSRLQYADGFEGVIRASLPIWQQSRLAVRAQASLVTWHTAQNAQWVDMGLGIVARRQLSDTAIIGANIFYDHNANHNLVRMGLGADWQSPRLRLFANGYWGVADETTGKDGHRLTLSDGAELGAQLRLAPVLLGVRAGAWQETGVHGAQTDIQDWAFAWQAETSIALHPLVSLTGQYRSGGYGQGDHVAVLGVALRYPPAAQGAPFASALHAFVAREERLLHASVRPVALSPCETARAAQSNLLTFATHATPLRIGAHRLTIEVADTPGRRNQGLMFRCSLAQNAGMLFVNVAGVSGFFMRNTYIPLDMIFLNAANQIMKIVTRRDTLSDRVTPLEGAIHVLEINAGRAGALGIRVGDTVVHPLLN